MDCGFELPDVRWENFIDDKHIEVMIKRNWYRDEDGEMDFDCYFDILENKKLILRVDSEQKAISIAEILYEIEDNEED